MTDFFESPPDRIEDVDSGNRAFGFEIYIDNVRVDAGSNFKTREKRTEMARIVFDQERRKAGKLK